MTVGEHNNESALISAAQAGNSHAYGDLVQRHQSGVFALCLRLVQDHQEALDLTQETFVRGYRALDSFEPHRPFGPWIRRIATNLSFNWLQRHKPPTVPLPDEAEIPLSQLADPSADVEQHMLAVEQRDLLRRAIQQLPAPYRAVIELRHGQDLSYETIADILNLPLSDVKSHLFRARRLLRSYLEGRL